MGIKTRNARVYSFKGRVVVDTSTAGWGAARCRWIQSETLAAPGLSSAGARGDRAVNGSGEVADSFYTESRKERRLISRGAPLQREPARYPSAARFSSAVLLIVPAPAVSTTRSLGEKISSGVVNGPGCPFAGTSGRDIEEEVFTGCEEASRANYSKLFCSSE